MGWGISENQSFPRVTENLLKDQTYPFKVEVINAGYTALDPGGYYLYYKREGRLLNPDIIVVGLYLGNDLNSRSDIIWDKVDERGLPLSIRSKFSYVDQFGRLHFREGSPKYSIPILKNSHLFIFLWDLLSPKDTNMDSAEEISRRMSCLFAPECHEMDQAKTEVKSLLKAIHSLAKDQGAQLVVLLIPAEFQVNFQAGYKLKYNLPLSPLLRRRLNDEFTNFFTQEDIIVVDPLAALIEEIEPTYFRDDEHWNAKGHQIAAQLLSTKLTELLKVDVSQSTNEQK
jgi:hypothetical protein